MKNINESELKKYILKRLQESYFDELEFDDEAMKAAMADIKADPTAGTFTPLGSSEFEKGSDFGKNLKSSLKQANLELPSDEEEVEYYAQLLKKRKAQEDRFGVGSLNEVMTDSKGNKIRVHSNIKYKDAKGFVEKFVDDKLRVVWIGSNKKDNLDKFGREISPKDVVVVNENYVLDEIEMDYITDSKGNPIKLKSQVKDIDTGVIGYVDRFMQDHDTLDMLVSVNWINRDELNVDNPIDPKKLIVTLKENTMMNEEAYEASRYMFFSNLQQIRRQAGLLLDMDEEKLQEILENGHDWAQDHIATAKESIDQVFDFLMNETNGGDMWKSVDVEDKEDEEEGGSEFDEEIEEGMGHSHTVGKGTNEKPVNYPETLMREAIKDVMEGMFDKYTSTTSTSGQFSKGGGFKKQNLTTMLDNLYKWMESTFKNKFIIKQEMPPQTTDKSPDAKKPIVYIWIPTNNPNAINVEYRNITSAVNYVTTNKHIEKILNKFDKLGVLVQLMKGKDATQAKFSLAMKQTGAQAEPATNQPATTQTAISEGYSVNEDEHIKLSFADKLKLWAKGVSEEQALANLNAGLPIDWTGSVEGYYEKDEPSRDYSGTNEAVEEGFLSKSKTNLQNPEQYIKNTTKDKLIQAITKLMSNFGGGVSINPKGEGETQMSRMQKQFWTGSDNDWNAFVDMAMNMKESSSDSLANKHGENAKPNVSYLKKEGYENIIELQDNQANHVFTLLKQDGPEEAIEYLKEFHKPGTHNILSEIKKSTLDKSYEKDGYTLTWNPSVGFVKLSYKTN